MSEKNAGVEPAIAESMSLCRRLMALTRGGVGQKALFKSDALLVRQYLQTNYYINL